MLCSFQLILELADPIIKIKDPIYPLWEKNDIAQPITLFQEKEPEQVEIETR
jgi:hypothetical protein